MQVMRHRDVDPRNRSRVNESPQPARLGRGLHHETHRSEGVNAAPALT